MMSAIWIHYFNLIIRKILRNEFIVSGKILDTSIPTIFPLHIKNPSRSSCLPQTQTVIFMLVNNGWAISTPTARQTAAAGLTGFPSFVAIGADGTVKQRASGELTTQQFEQLLAVAAR